MVVSAGQKPLLVVLGQYGSVRLLHFAAALPPPALTLKRQRFSACQVLTMQLELERSRLRRR